jgi:CTP synthase (UTP-ammonia lyase)
LEAFIHAGAATSKCNFDTFKNILMPTTSKKTILVAQVLEKREGKIAAQYAREKFRFGICLGMQMAIIEHARKWGLDN